MALDKKEIIEYIINGNKNDPDPVTQDDEFVFVDFTSFCSNACLYCQRSKNNWDLPRARMTKEEIVEAFKEGYASGKRRFFLYGGVDLYFYNERLTDVVKSIKTEYPDCDLYVAFGEKVYEDYQAIKDAGADGFALFHRSANEAHFAKLHTYEQYPDFRKKVQPFLREMGFKIGTGITIGWPYQTAEILAEDILYVEETKPDLIVVDTFVPQKGSDLESFPPGDKKQQKNVIKLVKKLLPDAIILTDLY